MNIFKSKINQTEESLTNLQESFDSLNGQYATIQEELKNAQELASTYKSEFERLDLENKDLKIQLEQKGEEVIEVVSEAIEIDELASMKAVEIIAQVGHEQVEVIEDDTMEEVTFDTKTITEQFKSLKGKELMNFYNENKKAIMDALRK